MKLKTDIVITLVSNLAFAFSQWVLIASLNYSDNVQAVGQYSYALALAGLFLTIGQTGLRQYLLSSTIPNSHIEQLLSTRLLMSILAWLLLLLYTFAFVDHVYLQLVLILGLAKIAENMSDIAHGFYQRSFKVVSIAWSRLARSILSPLIFLSVFFTFSNLGTACLALAISWLLVYLIWDHKAFKPEQKRWRKVDCVPQILTRSYSLGVTSTLVLLSVSIPLFLLAREVSDVEVGQYASVFYFVTAGSLIFQSVMQVMSPVIVNQLALKNNEIVKRLVRNSYLLALAYGAVGVLLASVIGEWVITLVYGENYIGLGFLVVLAAAINFALAMQAVGGIVLTAMGIFTFQMFMMIASVVVSGISGYVLISSYGVSGALYAGALTAVFNGLGFGVKVGRELLKQ